MMSQQTNGMVFPYKTVYDEQWDQEWSDDWRKMEEIFKTIHNLEELFGSLHVSILREITQKKLILDLQQYAYSLSKVIVEKYSD